MQSLSEGIGSMEGLGVFVFVLVIFALVLAVLWTLLPFAVFGIKGKLQRLLDETQRTNILLGAIRAHVDAASNAPVSTSAGGRPAVVAWPSTKLRSSPSATGTVVAHLTQGMALTVFSSREGFMQVATADKVLEGWVLGSALDLTTPG